MLPNLSDGAFGNSNKIPGTDNAIRICIEDSMDLGEMYNNNKKVVSSKKMPS